MNTSRTSIALAVVGLASLLASVAVWCVQVRRSQPSLPVERPATRQRVSEPASRSAVAQTLDAAIDGFMDSEIAIAAPEGVVTRTPRAMLASLRETCRLRGLAVRSREPRITRHDATGDELLWLISVREAGSDYDAYFAVTTWWRPANGRWTTGSTAAADLLTAETDRRFATGLLPG